MGYHSLLPSLPFSLSVFLQCASLPPMSSPTNCMYRTIPQPSQEPASPYASGSSLQKRRFCSMTTSLLSTISFTRCAHMSVFLCGVCMYVGFFSGGFNSVSPIWPCLCRLWMMWRKTSSKQSRSLTSCRSWLSRRRCPWSVSRIWTDTTQLLYCCSWVTYTDRVTHCSSACLMSSPLSHLFSLLSLCVI